MRRLLWLLGVGPILAWVVVNVLGWVNSLSALSLTAAPGESLQESTLKSLVVLLCWVGAMYVGPVVLLTTLSMTLVPRIYRWFMPSRWAQRRTRLHPKSQPRR